MPRWRHSSARRATRGLSFDAIWAALNGLGAASAAGDDMNPQQDQVLAVGIAWLAVSGISAIAGFSKERMQDREAGAR